MASRVAWMVSIGLLAACSSGRARQGDTGPEPRADSGADASVVGRDAGPIGADGAFAIDAGRDAPLASDARAASDAGRDAALTILDAGNDAATSPDAGGDAGPVTACSSAVDCTACPTGYCSGGTCGASPSTLTYGFESGALPRGWTMSTGSTAPWTVVASGAHGGTYRAQSGSITHSQTTGLAFPITLAHAATISFWLGTGTESCCDHLLFFVDGAQLGSWSGTTGWMQVSFPLGAGMHTIEWRYTKDASVSVAPDAVWIDDITISVAAGSPNTDFESGTLPSAYTTGGNAGWTIDTSMAHSPTHSARSGVITDSQTSSMTTAITLPAASTLTFWYTVSSEPNYDYLRVLLDGRQLGQWSGTVPWTMASFPLAAGSHTVEWRYVKDASISRGSDAAWVDDINFGFTPPAGATLCAP